MQKTSLAAESRPAPRDPKPRAFEDLFYQLADAAFGMARCLRPAEEAMALVQAAALAAHGEFRDRETGDDFRLWFFRLLLRTHLATRPAKASCEGSPELDDTPDLYLYARSGSASLPTDGPDPAATLLDTMGTDRVVAAMARLAEEYRLVCTCYFIADLNYEEIARVLGYPMGTVRARLHRGRKMLQKALWQIAQEDGIVPAAARATP